METSKWTEARPAVNPEGLGADATAADLFALGMAAACAAAIGLAGSDALQRMAMLAGDGDRPVRSVTDGQADAGSAAWGCVPASRPFHPEAVAADPAELIAAQGFGAAVAMPSAGNDKRVAAIWQQPKRSIFIEGRRDEALVLARQAAVVEEGLSFEFDRRCRSSPHELVGDLLMDVRRPGRSRHRLEAALRRHAGAGAVPAGPLPVRHGIAAAAEGHTGGRGAPPHLAARRQDAARAQGSRRGSVTELVLGSLEVLGLWGLGVLGS